jgi:hypothetical protein
MDIISRNDARLQAMTLYFTGEPCKNGHISPRYVQSGTCRLCITGENPNRPKVSEEKLEQSRIKLALRQTEVDLRRRATVLREERKLLAADRETRISQDRTERIARRQALADMQTILIHLSDANITAYKATLLTFAQMRCPTLVLADVVLNVTPRPGQIYSFRCFPEHKADLYDIQNQLWREETLSGVAIRRAQIIAAADEVEEWPEETA